jgi:S1-C subfamily serine protease
MTQEPNFLSTLSDLLVARFAVARASVAAVRLSESAHLGAILWGKDALVTSEQSLPEREALEAVLPDGSRATGKLAGRDPATNVAVIRLDGSAAAPTLFASAPQIGALVIAAGVDRGGRASARLGAVNAVGPEWHSMRGGRIEARIQLDVRLARHDDLRSARPDSGDSRGDRGANRPCVVGGRARAPWLAGGRIASGGRPR